MLDKTRRIESLIGPIGAQLKAQKTEIETASQAAHLCKADLVTKMVVEMTSLQGVMGRIYHSAKAESPRLRMRSLNIISRGLRAMIRQSRLRG